MATFTVNRTSTFSTSYGPETLTSGRDYLRGSGASDFFFPPVPTLYADLGVATSEIEDAVFAGRINRELTDSDAAAYYVATDPLMIAVLGAFGISYPTATTFDGALDVIDGNTPLYNALMNFITTNYAFLEATFGGFGLDIPDVLATPVDPIAESYATADPSGRMAGDDRIYGRGGDDVIVDLFGNNLVVTEEGDDRIRLGMGADRIYDDGGDNVIVILGGNNYVKTGDGDDRVTTGAGADNINVFDGANIVDAGDGANRVRGGDGRDEFTVGLGDDFVELRSGTLLLDANGAIVTDADGNPIEDFGVLDLSADGFATLTELHNWVLDMGGSDSFNATANSRNDVPGFPDKKFNGNDGVVSDYAFFLTGDASVLGADTFNLGGGDNVVIDFGGNSTVRTLEGDDQIFTSFGVASDDAISTGAGSDLINAGAGVDVITPGPGQDDIVLEVDGDFDTIIYKQGDQAFNLIDDDPNGVDFIEGFDSFDVLDVSGLELTAANLRLSGINAGGGPALDVLVAWDVNLDGALDFFTSVLIDAPSLSVANFEFFDPLVG